MMSKCTRLGDGVRQARPTAVEDHEAMVPRQLAQERRDVGFVPDQVDVGEPAGDVDDVDRPVANDLVGDVEALSGPRETCLGSLHQPFRPTEVSTSPGTYRTPGVRGSRYGAGDVLRGGAPMSGEMWAIAAAAAAIGVLGGLAVALWKRPQVASGNATNATEAQLAVQSAELRRLADQASQRDLSAEQLRAGLESARRALDELRVREQERRSTDADQREVDPASGHGAGRRGVEGSLGGARSSGSISPSSRRACSSRTSA